jgi:hypothetical protein
MYKSSFGSKGQIQFANEHEFYTFLGYLAKSDGSTSIVWEHNENQGAWGSEGRIQVHISNMPNIGQMTITAGNGGDVISRINCNEFVENICTNHRFVYGKQQDVIQIRQTIPSQYQADFDNGLRL